MEAEDAEERAEAAEQALQKARARARAGASGSATGLRTVRISIPYIPYKQKSHLVAHASFFWKWTIKPVAKYIFVAYSYLHHIQG